MKTHPKIRSIVLLIFMSGLVVTSANSVKAAPFFYSISVLSGDDELVKVDATTGDVFTIGSLGPSRQFEFPSLTTLNGRLFAVHSVTAGDPVELIEINPLTGSILSSTQIMLSGGTIPLVEGFDTDNGQLVIGYGLTAGGGSGFRSERIGKLAIDGTVSDTVVFSSSDDLDGIAVNSLGDFLSTDATAPSVGSEIRSVSLSPPSTSLLMTIGSVDTDIVDLAFTQNDLLFGLDLDKLIHRIDPVTGNSLSAALYDPSLTLRGMAFIAPPSAVPEPSTVSFLSLVVLVLIRQRRRKKV